MADTDVLLRHTYYRRQFLLLGGVALLVLGLVRFLVLPRYGVQSLNFVEMLSSIVETLMVAIAASLGTLVYVLWAVPSNVRVPDVHVIAPRELKRVLAENLSGTQEFWYRGHTARWTRAITLRQLAQQSERDHRSRRVYLIISDPTDSKVCEHYVRYACTRYSTGGKSAEDVHEMQIELYATIISAYMCSAKVPQLELHIALSNRASLFRVDLTSKAAIITTPDPKDPALLYGATGYFHGAMREDLHDLFQQCRQLPSEPPRLVDEQLNAPRLREFLTSLGIATPTLSEDDLTQVIGLARAPYNPYPG
jgi:hypothetical protein